MSYSFYITYDRTDAYKASIFTGFVDSPPPVGNTAFSFLLLSFFSLSLSTVFPSSAILDGDLPVIQCWPGIWRWWINVLFSSTQILLMPLSFMFSVFHCIDTGTETGSPSDVLGASLDLCGTIISSINCSPRNPLTKTFFLVVIEALIVWINGHESIVLNATSYLILRDNVTIFMFTTEGVL